MKAETLKILLEADDAVELEAPKDFDWHTSMSEVRALKTKLELVLGRSLKIDDQVQDASYFAQLYLSHSASQDNSPKIILDIYFSTFGRLFTIWSDCSTDEFSDEMLEKVKGIIKNQGFRFVESDELNEEYTGIHEGIRKAIAAGNCKHTWCLRFFSYI